MKLRKTTFFAVAGLACVALFCGCQKQDEKSPEEAARQLQRIKTAVNTSQRKGEAFVVLKSDQVIYIADMQILCLKADFEQHFASWKSQCNAALSDITEYDEKSDPILQTKLKQIDDEIATQLSKTNHIRETGYTRDQIREWLIRKLEEEKDLFEGQVATLNSFQDGGLSQRAHNRLDRMSERLKQLKAGGVEADKIIEAEIGDGAEDKMAVAQTRVELRKVENLRYQRAKAIEDVTEKARINLEEARANVKTDFKAKFYRMLNDCTVSTVQTGSKGDFNIPAEIAYLYAERHRESGETIIWLTHVDSSSPEIRMSNSNAAIAAADYDEFWMLKWNLE